VRGDSYSGFNSILDEYVERETFGGIRVAGGWFTKKRRSRVVRSDPGCRGATGWARKSAQITLAFIWQRAGPVIAEKLLDQLAMVG
jgi:hypothetical protein